MTKNNLDAKSKSRRRPAQETAATATQDEVEGEDPFPNFNPPLRLVVLQLLVLILLGIVTFSSPDSGVGIIKSTSESLGLLSSCTGKVCSPYLGGSAAGSNATSPATTASANTATRRSTPDLSIRASAEPAAGSDTANASFLTSLNIKQFYLTTGLAAICAFLLIFFAFHFTFIRLGSKPPLVSMTKEEEAAAVNEAAKLRRSSGCGCLSGLWFFSSKRRREGFKRYAYRASRVYLFFLFWLVLGIAGDATRTAYSTGLANIEGGIYLLWFTWILLILVTIIEFFNRTRLLSRILLKGNFAAGLCGLGRLRKWKADAKSPTTQKQAARGQHDGILPIYRKR